MPPKTVVKNRFNQVYTPLRIFFADSRAAGIVLIVLTMLSLVLANWSVTSSGYTHFWQQTFHWPVVLGHLPETNLLFVNDVLMTFFFFLVGMEIKRELLVGELAVLKKSMLPIVAAIGGMLLPALLFLLFNLQTAYRNGWGIPMATDIAFSLGILSLLGNRINMSLRIFLVALAIIDDLGAVVTIALFYTGNIQLLYLLFSCGIIVVVVFINQRGVNALVAYLIPGIALWFCLFHSGIHATLAGVIMSFAMPLKQLAKLEHQLFAPVNFFIMPLFALANTAIVLPTDMVATFIHPISIGVLVGLVFGKPLGIFLFSYVAVRCKLALLPSHTTWGQLLGIGMLGGIGFTMSIFTTSLAYDHHLWQINAKVAVMAASAASAGLGLLVLLWKTSKSKS